MYKPSYVKSILYTEDQIRAGVARCGKWITENFKNCEKPPVLVCILKGASVFFSELLRRIETEVEIDFTTMSSYRGTVQITADPKMVTNLTKDVKDRDVIIVEDILDTANTLTKLISSIKQQKPKSVSTVVLIDKVDCRVKPLVADYACFSIKGNPFIIGFGLDANEKGRNLPYIADVDQEYIK